MFDLTSLQVAIENYYYTELVREPLSLELKQIYPLEHVTELIVLPEWMSLVAVYKFGLVGENA